MRHVLLILLSLMLTSVTVFANGQQDAAQAIDEKSEISIMWWGSQNRHDRTIKVIELYMEQNPNVTITYEFAGWADYWTKVTTMAAGGQLPDIMQHNYPLLGTWVEKGLLQSWDKYIDNGIIDFSNIEDNAVKSGAINDSFYGINLGMNSQCIVLDLDLFEKAGIAVPDQDWTWEDFYVMSKAFKDKLGIYGLGAGLWNQDMWRSLYLANGEWSYTPDGKTIGYKSDDLFNKHMTMALDLIEYGAYPRRDIEITEFANGDNAEQQAIVTGKAAMAYIWSNQLTALSTAAGDNRRFAMIHLPRLTKNGAAANYLKPSQFFALTRDAKNPEEAAKFVNFITNSIDANDILFAERGIPVSSVIRDSIKPQLDPNKLLAFDYLDIVAKDSSPIPNPDPAGHSEIIKNVFTTQVVDQVAFKEITPAQGSALLRDEIINILAQ